MKNLSASDIAEMPIQQRIQLVEDLWDSIAELPESVEIPTWRKQELEKRLDAYHENPEEGSALGRSQKKNTEVNRHAYPPEGSRGRYYECL